MCIDGVDLWSVLFFPLHVAGGGVEDATQVTFSHLVQSVGEAMHAVVLNRYHHRLRGGVEDATQAIFLYHVQSVGEAGYAVVLKENLLDYTHFYSLLRTYVLK